MRWGACVDPRRSGGEYIITRINKRVTSLFILIALAQGKQPVCEYCNVARSSTITLPWRIPPFVCLLGVRLCERAWLGLGVYLCV